MTREASPALSARCNRSHQHAVADVVSGNSFAELFNNANRLVTDDQAGLNRIFAPNDMHIGSAIRSERHANDSLAGAGAWFFYLFDSNVVFGMKNICLHFRTPCLITL